MSSTLKAAVEAAKNRIASVYAKITEKGGTLPTTQDLANLPDAIDTIPSGGGKIAMPSGLRFQNSTATGDISEFTAALDTSAVTTMENMFYSNKWTTADLSGWDTSKVTTFVNMFRSSSAKNVAGLETLKTSAATNMSSMFYQNTQIGYGSTFAPQYDTSNVTNMTYMFYGFMTSNASVIPTLDIRTFDTSKADVSNMFVNCRANFIRVGSGFVKGVVLSSSSLLHDGLVQLFNDLPTITTAQTLTLGTTKLGYLSDDEKAIATNKGWTLA